MRVKKFNWNNYQSLVRCNYLLEMLRNCNDNAREYHLKKKTHQAIKQTNNRKQDKTNNNNKMPFLLSYF